MTWPINLSQCPQMLGLLYILFSDAGQLNTGYIYLGAISSIMLTLVPKKNTHFNSKMFIQLKSLIQNPLMHIIHIVTSSFLGTGKGNVLWKKIQMNPRRARRFAQRVVHGFLPHSNPICILVLQKVVPLHVFHPLFLLYWRYLGGVSKTHMSS